MTGGHSEEHKAGRWREKNIRHEARQASRTDHPGSYLFFSHKEHPKSVRLGWNSHSLIQTMCAEHRYARNSPRTRESGMRVLDLSLHSWSLSKVVTLAQRSEGGEGLAIACPHSSMASRQRVAQHPEGSTEANMRV